MKRYSFIGSMLLLPLLKVLGKSKSPLSEVCKTQGDQEGPYYKGGAPLRKVIESEGEALTIQGVIVKSSDCSTPYPVLWLTFGIVTQKAVTTMMDLNVVVLSSQIKTGNTLLQQFFHLHMDPGQDIFILKCAQTDFRSLPPKSILKAIKIYKMILRAMLARVELFHFKKQKMFLMVSSIFIYNQRPMIV